MDAQDTRTAQERIDQAEGRLAALLEQGIDTAGLDSQLEFARAALAQGQTLEVMAVCEEVLITAKRLLSQPPPSIFPPGYLPGKSEHSLLPDEPATSDVYPALGRGTDSGERLRLTEEIRQAVNADLQPKGLTAMQVDERIRTSLEQSLDQALQQALGQSLKEKFTLLHEQLSSKMDERFQRLAAEPTTTAFSKPGNDDDFNNVEERLAAAFDQHLEARTMRIGQQTAQSIAAAADAMQAQLTELADPQRQQAVIVEAVDAAIGQALAENRLQTNIQLESTLTAIDAAIPAAISQALQHALPETVANVVQAVLPSAVKVAVQEAVQSAMATVSESVATPVRELVTEALTQAAVHSAPPDLEALATRLGNDLRADIDWQMERLAAEKGWVTLADVHAELRTTAGGKTLPDPGTGAGFARLEAALVEFVRQTQSQQQQFLNVLQERVEQGTAVVALNVARALGIDKNRSSTIFHPPSKPNEGDTASLNRATDVPQRNEQSALESLTSKPSDDGDLDVLSMTAQHRAIDTLKGPPPALAQLTMTAMHLPGTLVSHTAGTATPPAKRSAREEVSSASRPATMTIDHRSALDADHSPLEAAEDAAATIALGPVRELGTEAMELSPLQESTDDVSGRHEPLTQKTDDMRGESASRSKVAAAMAVADMAGRPSDDGKTTRVIAQQLAAAASASGTSAAYATSSSSTASTASTSATSATRITDAPTPPNTSRVAAFNSGLRTLVKDEVQRQLAPDALSGERSTATITRELSQQDLHQHIRQAVEKALAELYDRPHSNAELRLTVPCDTDLRAAITRSMPDMLQDPAIRQQILGVVAVEAVANPGALGELTGIRAFIRAEVRHAHREAASPEKESETVPSVNPQAREHATSIIS